LPVYNIFRRPMTAGARFPMPPKNRAVSRFPNRLDAIKVVFFFFIQNFVKYYLVKTNVYIYIYIYIYIINRAYSMKNSVQTNQYSNVY